MKRFVVYIQKNSLAILVIGISLLSIACSIYFHASGLTTVFGDSKGHMNISRRVVDSPTPGLAQLGAYWLPLAHVLTIPFVGNDFLWSSGIAGTWFNMIGYVLATVYLFKLIDRVTDSKLTATLFALVFSLNPNILFIQSTPMTETLFIATTVIGAYYFICWTLDKRLSQLTRAAAFIMLATLTRYEGWALAAFATVLIFFQIILSKGKARGKSESDLIIFSVVAWLGIVLWIMWGAILVGDPLDFMRNDLSAKSQTSLYYEDIKATGDGNVLMAIVTNIFAVYHTAGPIIATFLVVGPLIHLISQRKRLLKPETYVIFILLMPFLFDILTVFTGNVPVEVPEFSKQAPPGNMFNIRYSLFVLPFVAVMIAKIFRNRMLNIAIFTTIIISYALLIVPSPRAMAVLNEAGASGTPAGVSKTINWFVEHYDKGLILASTGAMDGLMYDTQIPLKNFVTEGSFVLWPNSMKNPQEIVEWVLLDEGNKRDAVNNYIDKKMLKEHFTLVYKSGTFTIWKRAESGQKTRE